MFMYVIFEIHVTFEKNALIDESNYFNISIDGYIRLSTRILLALVSVDRYFPCM